MFGKKIALLCLVFCSALIMFAFIEIKEPLAAYNDKSGELQENLKFRKEMGLKSDVDYTKSIIQQYSDSLVKYNKYGVLLTEEPR